MVAARVGRDGYVRQIAGCKTGEDDTRARYVPWAIFEICGEQLWTETPKKRSPPLEQGCPCVVCACVRVCLSQRTGKYFQAARSTRFQVDMIAGDGNKACYLATPKAGGCPTYEVSLLQFWIGRMVHTATQARIKNYGKAPAVRVKHFMSCSYKDLDILGENP